MSRLQIPTPPLEPASPAVRAGPGLAIEAWLLAAWVLLAGLAISDAKIAWLLGLPWCLVALRGRSAVVELGALWQAWRVPLACSVVGSSWIALGAAFGPPRLHAGATQALLAIAWVPVAVLLMRQRRAGWPVEALLASALLLVVLANAVRVAHQMIANGVVRPGGYTHNVLVGPYMMALALVALVLWRAWRGPPRLRAAAGALGLAVALGIALASDARTPLVAGMLACAGVALAWRLRAPRLAWVALVAFVVVWAVGTSARWQLFVVQSLQYAHDTHKTSVGARVDMLRWAARHAAEIPPFGFGEAGLAERMNQRHLEFDVADDRIYTLIHMHNDVLQMSFAHGLVAGVALAVFVATLLVGLYRRRRTRDSRPAADVNSAAAAAAIGIVAVSGLFDCFLYWPKVWLGLQAIVAIVIAMNTAGAARPDHAA